MPYPAFVLLFLSLLSLDLQAEIYTWQDEKRQTHFGDRPPDKAQANEVKLRINTYQSPEIRSLGVRSFSGDADKVTLYSAQWCGVCKKAKRFFIEKNIPFEEYDVEKSQRGRRDYKRLQGKGVPIILVGDQRMNGFSPERFESIYQRQRP
jgi:glutaredoxin